jgi:hypothetical protein
MAKKHTGPRLVNPEGSSSRSETPWKTIILTAMVTSVAGAVALKIFEHVWEKGKTHNPFRAMNPPQHPVSPFQSPYSQMAQTQGLPFNHLPEAPPSPSEEEAPPRWAQAFIEAHESRLQAIEQRLDGPQIVGEEDAA